MFLTWQPDLNDPVETTWTVGDGGIDGPGMVGCGDRDDTRVPDHPVHALEEFTKQRMVGHPAVHATGGVDVLDHDQGRGELPRTLIHRFDAPSAANHFR